MSIAAVPSGEAHKALEQEFEELYREHILLRARQERLQVACQDLIKHCLFRSARTIGLSLADGVMYLL